MAYHLIGIDLGGTKLAAGLTDTDCRIERQERFPVPHPWDVEETLDAMASVAMRVAQDFSASSILGVGVAIAGVVDRQAGRLVTSPVLGWTDVALRQELKARLPWDVFVASDFSLATLGEWKQGAGRDVDTLLGVFVGSAIGAGLVLDGFPYEGRHFSAGQIGRQWVTISGFNNSGQRRARLEEIASGPALCHRVVRAKLAGEASQIRMTPGGMVSVEEIGRAEALGDQLALRTIAETADALGVAVANAVTLLDPERVVLGGGVVRAIPSLVDRVREIVRRHGDYAGVACPHEVVAARFGREAPIIGGAVLAKTAGRIADRREALAKGGDFR